MSEALVVTDPCRRISFVNAAFERLCGYTAAEVHGLNPGELLQGPDTERGVVRRLRQTLDRRAPFTGVLTNYRKGGIPYRVRLRIAPLVDRHGRLEGFFALETEACGTDAEILRLEQEVGSLYDLVVRLAPEVNSKTLEQITAGAAR